MSNFIAMTSCRRRQQYCCYNKFFNQIFTNQIIRRHLLSFSGNIKNNLLKPQTPRIKHYYCCFIRTYAIISNYRPIEINHNNNLTLNKQPLRPTPPPPPSTPSSYFPLLFLSSSRLTQISHRQSTTSAINLKNLTKMHDKFNYPVARRDESVIDDYHGNKISDPYRWLEDPDSTETQAFVDAQNAVTQPYLEQCDKWQPINEKLTKLWNYPKYTAPARHGDSYYFYINSGLQNQHVLYKQSLDGGEPEVFLDPNTLSEDGTIALTRTSFSDDGELFAYGLSESGSDWFKIKIRNVKTGEDYPEVLNNVRYSSITWTKDNKGIFYCCYPHQANTKADGSETVVSEHQKLFYHRVGEPQEKDVLCVEFLDQPSYRMAASVSDCGKYLILLVSKDCRDNLVYFVDIKEVGDIREKLTITQVVFKLEADYEYVTNTDNLVVFRTNKNAPNYRLITIDFNKPAEENWKTLIAENETDVLDWADCVNQNKLIIGYIHDVKSVLSVHSLETGEFLRSFPLEIGTIGGFSGNKKYSEIYYHFVSFLTPGTIYKYDFAKPNDEPTILRQVELKIDSFDHKNYVVEQIFYSSKDGTKIPMFIIHKKSEEKKKRPCLLYGYGGFNISIQPMFSITGLMFIELFDGVIAYPNIRGGGEYGEKWHNAGRLLNKQNGFDDFQKAGEYLIEQNYTENGKIVIQGGSNGGLLVGACINQRPDLFGAAVAQVGVLDMLRFHKFTIAHSWISDYGCSDDKEHFDNLFAYSPLHNVKAPKDEKHQYPATLILTADHDDRVSPLHSLKYAAALQYLTHESQVSGIQKNPLLLRVYSKAGHGAGKPTTKKIEEATDILTFMYRGLKLDIIE